MTWKKLWFLKTSFNFTGDLITSFSSFWGLDINGVKKINKKKYNFDSALLYYNSWIQSQSSHENISEIQLAWKQSHTHTHIDTSIHFTHALSFLIACERFFVIDVESWLLLSFSKPVFFGNVELKVKWRKVLHLCEIWNIISKYMKAQCLINVFRIQIGRCILLSFFLSDHAVNKCMFFPWFLFQIFFPVIPCFLYRNWKIKITFGLKTFCQASL